jgi:hypothetical protein
MIAADDTRKGLGGSGRDWRALRRAHRHRRRQPQDRPGDAAAILRTRASPPLATEAT